MGRVGTGLTSATIPLVVALAFAQAGDVIPAVLACVLTGALIVATFSAYLPVLHRLPFVGAPRLTGGFTVNGSPALNVRIPKQLVDSEPIAFSLLIQVGITNHSRADVDEALFNFCALAGHALRICDHRGEPVDRGNSMPSTNDEPAFDYWAIPGVTYSGRNAFLTYFRLRVQRPGSIPVILRVQSRDLYEELVVGGTIEVTEIEGDSTPSEAVSASIEEGEWILREAAGISDSDLRTRVAAFDFRARNVVAGLDRPDWVNRLDNALLDYSGRKVGKGYFEALTLAFVRVLYDIRRLIAR
jgi:hypothetical protein